MCALALYIPPGHRDSWSQTLSNAVEGHAYSLSTRILGVTQKTPIK